MSLYTIISSAYMSKIFFTAEYIINSVRLFSNFASNLNQHYFLALNVVLLVFIFFCLLQIVSEFIISLRFILHLTAIFALLTYMT